MSIDVYATARAIEKDLKEHLVIVVDVLRASSVMITAIENGCKSLIPVLEAEDAVAVARRFGNEKVLLCGERNGAMIDGFNLSNSPREFTGDNVSGRMLVMTTTNGTRAILETGACK
ncbi:MAG: 2-phosphosulfolactate phosphatase, partial [Christensenellaceae bacterium]|nr:2-phosphosulfolactate phosphatase [Christensenellaceae bacterium]